MKKRNAIIVLGMHRSGTSMVAGMLNILGFDLGGNTWGPDFSNQKGYFENAEIVSFNDRLLKSLQSNWYSTYLLPEGWWEFPTIREQTEELVNIISRQFDKNSDLLFKDPRISVLLPFYHELFERLNIRPSYVICLRHPSEVYDSLKKRDNLPHNKVMLLWADHNFKAELFTRGKPRVFLNYSDVLSKPMKHMEIIFANFGFDKNMLKKREQKINAFADSGLKHHHVNMEYQEKDSMSKLYSLLSAATLKTPDKSVISSLDSLRKDLYDGLHFFRGETEHHAMLHITRNNGERDIMRSNIGFGDNKLSFSIEKGETVREIKLIPSDCEVVLKIERSYLTNENGKEIELAIENSNAVFVKHEKIWYFNSEIPKLTFKRVVNEDAVGMCLEINYIAFGTNVSKILTADINDENKQLHAKVNKINQLLTDHKNMIGKMKSENEKYKAKKEKELKISKQKVDDLILDFENYRKDKESVLQLNQHEIHKLKHEIIKYKEDKKRIAEQHLNQINAIDENSRKQLSVLQAKVDEYLQKMRIMEESYSLRLGILNQRIYHLNTVNTKLENRIIDKELQMSDIRHSLTWRLGHFFLWPAKKMYQLLSHKQ